MPDSSDPTIIQDELKEEDIPIPREDILKLVNLSAETAQKLAHEESQNTIRLRTSYESGQTIYDQIKNGQEVGVVTIGSGQFPITAQEKPADFVKVCIQRVGEVKPQPPADEVKKLLEGFGDKALTDSPKEFQAATTAYNYLANGNLKSNEELLKKLTTAAQTDQEKYFLARALEEVISPEEPTKTPPQDATDQLYSQLQPQAQSQEQVPGSTQPEIKKPYLPFANYKPQQVSQNDINQTYPPASNGHASTPPANEPNLRPVPPRPQIQLAQDIATS